MKIYNLMTGHGFPGGFFTADWWKAWIFLGLFVLLWAICKKWLGEEEMAGIPWNFIGGLLGILVYIVWITFTGLPKIGFIIGLLAIVGGGFLLGGMNN